MSTYTPIATVTLGSNQQSVTFSAIPQSYTDLILIMNAKLTTSGFQDIGLRFNGDSGANYSRTWLEGSGSAAQSGQASNETDMAVAGYYDNTNWTTQITNFYNYSNSTTYKTVINRESTSYGNVGAKIGLWRSTAPITTIVASPRNSGYFASGSTFNLYGIASASIVNSAKATGGSSVYTDGSYWYHVFLSSGAFTPTQNVTVDYLVVAGGGGGGVGGNGNSAYGGGGGGAGGVRCTVGATGGGGSLESQLSLTASTIYPVIIGAGGVGIGSGPGGNGSDSTFASITSTGGGGGGGTTPSSGQAGGSGGGASNSGSAGARVTGQGYAGGTASGQGGGGGGGAGAVGSNATGNNGAAGGIGIQTSISGTATYYGGGGGGGGTGTTSSSGGAGGSGGGGTGSGSDGSYTPAQDNTGGGGYGGNNARGTNEKGGGSGIVIVRYAV